MTASASDGRQRTFALLIAFAAIAVDGAAAPSAAGAVGAAEAAWRLDSALRDAASLAFDLPYELALLASLWMLDNHGKRGYFRGSLLGYASACLMAALAPSPAVFVTARALQGACLGGLFASALFTLVGVAIPKRLPAVFAVFTLVALAAPTLGPLVTGFVTASAGWRATFALLAVVPLVAGIAASLILHDVESPRARFFDTASFAALALVLLSLHGAIADFTEHDPDAFLIAAAGAVALAWFVVREVVLARDPFVDITPLSSPFLRFGLVACALVGTLLGVTATIVPFAQAAFGDRGIGTELAAWRFAGELPGAYAVYALRAANARVVALVGIVAFAATFAVQALAAAHGAGSLAHALVAVAQGFALALVLGPLASMLFGAAARTQFGAVALLFKIALVVGGALAAPFTAFIVDGSRSAAAYASVWFSAALVGGLAAVVLAFAPTAAEPASEATA